MANFEQPTAHAVFRTALRLKLFDRVGVSDVVSSETLAEATGSEKILIGECFGGEATLIIALLGNKRQAIPRLELIETQSA